MKSATISYKDDSYDVEITIRQATVLDGMKRAILEIEATAESLELDLVEEKHVGYLRFMISEVYPSCLASVESIENGEDAKKKLSKDMSFDEFASLPDALFQQWQKVVYKLNPHWVYRRVETKEGEEQEPTDSES